MKHRLTKRICIGTEEMGKGEGEGADWPLGTGSWEQKGRGVEKGRKGRRKEKGGLPVQRSTRKRGGGWAELAS